MVYIDFTKITPFVEVFFFHFLQRKQGLEVKRKGCKDAFVHNYNNVIMCQAMKLLITFVVLATYSR